LELFVFSYFLKLLFYLQVTSPASPIPESPDLSITNHKQHQ